MERRVFQRYREVSALRLPFERVEGAMSAMVGGSRSGSVALLVLDRHDPSGVGKEATTRDALQARCTFLHVVSDVVHAIEEGVNNLLPVKTQVRRQGSRQHVVPIVHELVDRARKTDSQISALSDTIDITHQLAANVQAGALRFPFARVDGPAASTMSAGLLSAMVASVW
jgi:hypothetical protein